MSERRCFLCGRNGAADPLDRHHIFGGSNRGKSEKYGLVVYLCHNRCHIFGAGAVHQNAEVMRELHEYGQKKYMAEHNATADDFRELFGKNYL